VGTAGVHRSRRAAALGLADHRDDLRDLYWDAQGRKSVDAAIIFGGLLSIASVASEGLEKAGWMPKVTHALTKLDIRRKLPPPLGTDAPTDSDAHPDPESAAPAESAPA
jgi:hypothetical protein